MKAIPVFYCPEMVAQVGGISPSAGKPARLIEQWTMQCQPIEIRVPDPVTVQDFYRVHDRKFVDGVLALQLPNGFGDWSPEVAASLAFTSGSMLAAAREAIANRCIAVAPCSGFHHAHYASNGGFCTFNGLMVAAAALKEEGSRPRRIGILDCDHHYGDGTDDILRVLGDSANWLKHYSAGSKYSEPRQAAEFLQKLPGIVRSFHDCDVMLYQAGADPHIDDPLGGWLTTEQLRQRDVLVFSTAREIGLPVAWNLAGGYQKPLSKVLDIHTNTLKASIDVYLDSA
ncbi:MAG: histone deacetylase [Panacagrimonas sp.]